MASPDELGLRAVQDPGHLHDLQATILGLPGLEQTKLSYRCPGRDFRLTDVGGIPEFLMSKLKKR